MTPTALVRRPGPRLADGLLTHLARSDVDVELARRQWLGYVEAFREAGWDVVEAEPADDCPDAVFIEDTMVIVDGRALLTRPGAEQRRAEMAGAEAAIRRVLPVVGPIEGPDTLDGGDVLQVGATIYIGMSGRTTTGAIEQVASLLPDRTVVGVPVSKVLHLKSAVTALPDGTIIGHPPVVDDTSLFEQFQAVPEESGSAVVDLGDGRLLMSSDCPRSAELIAGRGYEIVPVDISEYQKLEGCVTCLSVRISGS